jgi:predicted transcriptional regulator
VAVARLKKRETILIHMEILASLFASPKGPSRLAQSCNVNLGRIDDYAKALVEKGLIRSETMDKHEIFFITQEGLKVYHDWLDVWRRLPLG